MYLGEGTWRIWVPKWVIAAHCAQDDHYFCVPRSLLFECEDELVREAWERRYAREGFGQVMVVL